jgi:hypothetical protein
LGYTCEWIHALTSVSRKQEIIDEFQSPLKGDTPRRFRVLIGTSQILGQGVTLNRAHRLILMEPCYHAAVEAQVADRVHRLGSMTDKCWYYRFINTESELEELMISCQDNQERVRVLAESLRAPLAVDSDLPADPPLKVSREQYQSLQSLMEGRDSGQDEA